MKYLNEMKNIALLALLVCFLGACAASNTARTSPNTPTSNTDEPSPQVAKQEKEEYDPVGVWEYEVETPDGGSSGVMRITGEPGSYKAVLETDQFGNLDVEDLEIVGTTMTGYIEVAGTTAEIEGDFDGDSFSGAVVLDDQVFPLEATRTSRG